MIRCSAEDVRSWASSAGLDACGITDASPFTTARSVIEERKERGLHGGMHFTYGRPARSTEPRRTLETAESIVVGALGYHREPVSDESADDAAAPKGAVGRFVWEPVYDDLAVRLEAVAEELRRRGATAVVLVDDNRMVDRAAAHRAGLGWFGKNTNLLLGELGSWFVLGSIVTDAVIEEADGAAAEPMADGCGTCVRCQVACPTGALDTAGELDARRCLAWLLQADGVFPAEHREALGGRVYGCDDCQTVCPPNTRHVRLHPSPPAGSDARTHVDLLWMLSATDDELMERLGRWYIPRRRPEYLRRNALVALGNVADSDDPAVVAAVERSLQAPEEIVRAHAVWAARCLGLDRLVDELVVAGESAVVDAEIADRSPFERPDGGTGR